MTSSSHKISYGWSCRASWPHRLLLPALLALAFPSTAAWSVPPGIGNPVPREAVQDLRFGRFYKAGTRVRSPFLGISFVVPRDWRVRLPAGSNVIHMDSGKKPGLGVFLLFDDVTLEDLEARLSEPQAFEESYVLEPTDEIQREGPRLSASYLHGDKVGRAIALLGPTNQAIIYLVTGPAGEAASYDLVLESLAQSTRFLSEATALMLQQWYGRLSGMMLTSPRDEASDRLEEWHLCDNGTFLYQVRPSSETPEGLSTVGFEETGTWRLEAENEEVTLVVITQHGLPRARDLRYSGEQTYLDGKSFFSGVSDKCL